MRKKSNKIYREYFVNGTHMKRLYHLYIHKTIFDKILDILVLFAIIFSVIGLVLEFLGDIDINILYIVHSVSTIILVIFGLELLREYIKSNTFRDFFNSYWIDFILVVFLSFHFLFASYLGFEKLSQITKAKNAAQELKHFKITSNFIRDFFSK